MPRIDFRAAGQSILMGVRDLRLGLAIPLHHPDPSRDLRGPKGEQRPFPAGLVVEVKVGLLPTPD